MPRNPQHHSHCGCVASTVLTLTINYPSWTNSKTGTWSLVNLCLNSSSMPSQLQHKENCLPLQCHPFLICKTAIMKLTLEDVKLRGEEWMQSAPQRVSVQRTTAVGSSPVTLVIATPTAGTDQRHPPPASCLLPPSGVTPRHTGPGSSLGDP